MLSNQLTVCLTLAWMVVSSPICTAQPYVVLDPQRFERYVLYFNRMEDENIQQAIPNAAAWEWMRSSIPLLECPQDNFEEIYYYRWWSLRKHIRQTPSGLALTEFLVQRSYADQHNLISCALGHHIMEGRWIRDTKYIDQAIHVWFRGNAGGPMAKLHKFSSWAPYAVLQKSLVDGNLSYAVDLLPDLQAELEFWQRDHVRDDGLFWQFDVRDGMEEQISGSRKAKNARPTINSYMAGNAAAIARVAELGGKPDLAKQYQALADRYRQQLLERLWNPSAEFFEAVREDGSFANVREQIGYIPWYFDLPGSQHDGAWRFAKDTKGFRAPFGLTTAERSHPEFRSHGCCNCEWDGAVWPFATSQTLTGMANRLQRGECPELTKRDYFEQLELYVESQYYRGRPYIGEYLDETTGYWLKGDQERSRYYNHSTFGDLIISGLIGVRPQSEDRVVIHPLLPVDQWAWFCLDGVRYHGHDLTVLWDKDGTHYKRGQGFTLFVDGRPQAHAPTLQPLEASL